MGGIVSTHQEVAEMPLDVLANYNVSTLISVDKAPVFSFREILRGLEFCNITWQYLRRSHVGKYSLLEILHVYVLEALQTQPNDDVAVRTEKLLDESKRLRQKDPVGYALRFSTGLHKATSERSLAGRLRVLGREHARLGVDAPMLNVFCDAVLQALWRCLSNHPEKIGMMVAWSTTFKYILKEMCAIQYKFCRAAPVADEFFEESQEMLSSYEDSARSGDKSLTTLDSLDFGSTHQFSLASAEAMSPAIQILQAMELEVASRAAERKSSNKSSDKSSDKSAIDKSSGKASGKSISQKLSECHSCSASKGSGCSAIMDSKRGSINGLMVDISVIANLPADNDAGQETGRTVSSDAPCSPGTETARY